MPLCFGIQYFCLTSSYTDSFSNLSRKAVQEAISHLSLKYWFNSTVFLCLVFKILCFFLLIVPGMLPLCINSGRFLRIVVLILLLKFYEDSYHSVLVCLQNTILNLKVFHFQQKISLNISYKDLKPFTMRFVKLIEKHL